jgi:hypothetical protein
VSGGRRSLEPAPLAIVATATQNQDYDEYDEKCSRVHGALLWAIREVSRPPQSSELFVGLVGHLVGRVFDG